MLAHGWYEAFQTLDEGVQVTLIIFSAATISGCVWALSSAWCSAKQTERRARLASLLLDRGCRPDEIERVVRATNGKGTATADPDPEVAMAKHLTDNSYEGPDVQKVLSAARDTNALDGGAVRLVQTMAENWADAEDIAGVLRNRRNQDVQRRTPATA